MTNKYNLKSKKLCGIILQSNEIIISLDFDKIDTILIFEIKYDQIIELNSQNVSVSIKINDVLFNVWIKV